MTIKRHPSYFRPLLLLAICFLAAVVLSKETITSDILYRNVIEGMAGNKRIPLKLEYYCKFKDATTVSSDISSTTSSTPSSSSESAPEHTTETPVKSTSSTVPDLSTTGQTNSPGFTHSSSSEVPSTTDAFTTPVSTSTQERSESTVKSATPLLETSAATSQETSSPSPKSTSTTTTDPTSSTGPSTSLRATSTDVPTSTLPSTTSSGLTTPSTIGSTATEALKRTSTKETVESTSIGKTVTESTKSTSTTTIASPSSSGTTSSSSVKSTTVKTSSVTKPTPSTRTTAPSTISTATTRKSTSASFSPSARSSSSSSQSSSPAASTSSLSATSSSTSSRVSSSSAPSSSRSTPSSTIGATSTAIPTKSTSSQSVSSSTAPSEKPLSAASTVGISSSTIQASTTVRTSSGSTSSKAPSTTSSNSSHRASPTVDTPTSPTTGTTSTSSESSNVKASTIPDASTDGPVATSSISESRPTTSTETPKSSSSKARTTSVKESEGTRKSSTSSSQETPMETSATPLKSEGTTEKESAATTPVASVETPTRMETTKTATTDKRSTTTVTAKSSTEKARTTTAQETKTTGKTTTTTPTTTEKQTVIGGKKTTKPEPRKTTAATTTATEKRTVPGGKKTTTQDSKKTTAEPTSTSVKGKSTSASAAPSTSSKKATTTEKKTSPSKKAQTTKPDQVTTAKKEATTSSTKGTSTGKSSTSTKATTTSTTKPSTASTKQSSSSSGKATTSTVKSSSASTNEKQSSSSTGKAETSTQKSTTTSAQKTSESTATKTTATTTTTPITASSYEHMLRTTHPVDSVTQFQTITTQAPSERCDRECPEGYIVGETACIYPVPFYYANTYHRAFGFCASHEHSVLLTQQDLIRNRPSILKWARETNTTLLQTDIYLFAYPVPYTVKGRTYVDITTLGNLTLAVINTTRIGYFEKRTGMTALCKVPKYCESLNCPLEPVYEKLAAELPLPMVADEIPYRGTMELACKPPSKTILKLQCYPFSVIRPFVENLVCVYPPGLEPDLETPTNKRIRQSCADCYEYGTESCEAVDGGFVCNCKPRFHKFTCWKAEEVCKGREDNGLCSGRGKCTSLLGDFRCDCDRYFHGRQCTMDSRKVTMFGDGEHMPVISAPTISNAIIFLCSVTIWISVNVASGHLTQKFGDDGPQTVFVIIRNTNVFFSSLVATFFSRPALMFFNPVLCRLSYNIHYGCVYYALAMLVSETWNLANVYGAKGSNIWGYDPYGKYIKELSIDWGVLWAVLPLMPIIYAGNMLLWDSIYMSTTCLGPVSTTDPTYLVSIGILAGMVVAVFYYAWKAHYDRRNNEERIISMLHYMEIKLPLKIGRLDRVTRNRWFPVVLAPVLFLQYLLTQVSLDFVADGYFYLDLAVVVLGIVWAVLALAQFITIHDYVLEFVMVRCQPLFPFLPWPIHTPINYLNWDEIEALRTGNPVKNPERWKDWKYQPNFPDYVSEENRTHFLRKISSKYILHRTDGDMKPVEAMQAIFEEHTILLHKTTPLSEQLRELTTKWMLELNAWDIHELKLWHRPCNTEEEEGRQFIDHPFMTSSKIDAELRIVEGFKRIRLAMHYNPVRINDSVKVLQRGQNRLLDFFSTMFLVWRAEKPKVAPGRQRRQLAKLEKIYKKNKEQIHIDYCLAHPEADFTQDYLFNEHRPTFVGPRRRGSLYDFPYMSEFLAMKWYDERLNEQEWKDLEFDHWVSWRLISLDGVLNRISKFEEQVRFVQEYHAKREKYERDELIWRLGGRKEDHEHGKTYRQLKAERPSFEDRFPEYKEDKFATLPHEHQMMREGGLPMPPPRPRDLYLEELPREFPLVPDHGYADAAQYDF